MLKICNHRSYHMMNVHDTSFSEAGVLCASDFAAMLANVVWCKVINQSRNTPVQTGHLYMHTHIHTTVMQQNWRTPKAFRMMQCVRTSGSRCLTCSKGSKSQIAGRWGQKHCSGTRKLQSPQSIIVAFVRSWPTNHDLTVMPRFTESAVTQSAMPLVGEASDSNIRPGPPCD